MTDAPTDSLSTPTPRAVVEELLRRKVLNLTAAADAGHGDRDSIGQLVDEVHAFLDAVDATRTGVAYGDAVVIFGPGAPVVAHTRDYYATTAYWHTLAGGASGTVTAVPGDDVMRALST